MEDLLELVRIRDAYSLVIGDPLQSELVLPEVLRLLVDQVETLELAEVLLELIR